MVNEVNAINRIKGMEMPMTKKLALNCVYRGHCEECEFNVPSPDDGITADACGSPALNPMQVIDIKQARRDLLHGVCYVCRKGIERKLNLKPGQQDDDFVLLPADVSHGPRMRHRDCAPGSEVWLKQAPPSEGTISQEVREAFKVAKKKNTEKGAKEKVKAVGLSTEDISTLGRIKYMNYMDTALLEADAGPAPVWEVKGSNFSAKSNPEAHVVTLKVRGKSEEVPFSKLKERIDEVKKGR
jgi:hypothetical protein